MAKLSTTERQALIDHLIGNCDCGATPLFNEDNEDQLTSLRDDQLIALANNAEDADEVVDEEETEEEGSTEVSNAKKPPKVVAEEEDEDMDEEDMDEEETEVESKKKVPPFTKKKKAVFNESDLPQEVREDLQFARSMKQQKKDQLIAQIVSNEEGMFTKRELNAKDLDELTKIASYVKNCANDATANDADNDDEVIAPVRKSSARLGGHVRTTNNSTTGLQDEILETQTIDYSKI